MTRDAAKELQGTGGTSPVLGYLWPAVLVLATLGITVAVILGLLRHPARSFAAPVVSAPSAAPREVTLTPQTPAPRPPVCPAGTAGKQIIVGLADQRMALCQDGREVGDVPVTTGRVDRGAGTPVGRWKIESHDVNRTLSGPGYSVFVRYWLHIVGDIGLHDSPWQKFPYGDTVDYRTQGSQGCVHVPPAQMKKLYEWADDGTPITITA